MADLFEPSAAFSEQAWIKSFDQYTEMYERSISDPEGFWAEVAEDFHWFKKWDKVRDYNFDRREGKVFIRVFPAKPISKKPLEQRMGKGKAEPDFWAAVVKPGTILFEIAGVPENIAKQALARVAHKMPFKCRFVERRHA